MKSTNQRNTTYNAGFTSATGALFHREINALMPLILSEDWRILLKKEIVENEFLMINAESSRRKTISHVSKRIQYTFPDFWDIYASLSNAEQALMLFYLAMMAVPVIYDFHFDVSIPAWKGSSRIFEPYNYQMEMDQLGNHVEAVNKWFDSTRNQIIKIYKRMLKEAGFLNDESLIQPRRDVEFFFPFLKNRQAWFLEACFLSQAEIERITNLYTKSV